MPALNVLVIGSGGREHALAWKLRQSERLGQLYVTPGNAGTGSIAVNLDVSPNDFAGICKVAREQDIGLVVVGPEAPLAAGIANALEKEGIPVFGPTREAAQLEASKAFARRLMQKYGIPCPRGECFSSFAEARDYLLQQKGQVVVKADGLAAGKGVRVTDTPEQALEALKDVMERRVFGAAGDHVVIEERLRGQEVSLLAFTDGVSVQPMASACDYKRAWDGDQGPNTGGMGGYSPSPLLGRDMVERIEKTILRPVVKAMAQEGRPYKGVLYAGLMLTEAGPRVLEFNARFGDPETQVILPRMESDLLDVLLAVVSGALGEVKMRWAEDACVGVVMASAGYPGTYQTGFPIEGLDRVDDDILVFHAGTRVDSATGQVRTAGGRVFTVVAKGPSLDKARARVYLNLPCIRFQGCYYRKDIGLPERTGVNPKS